jgi:hypothetical protein
MREMTGTVTGVLLAFRPIGLKIGHLTAQFTNQLC